MSYIFFHHLSARATAAKSRKHQFSPVLRLLTLFFVLFFSLLVYIATTSCLLIHRLPQKHHPTRALDPRIAKQKPEKLITTSLVFKKITK